MNNQPGEVLAHRRGARSLYDQAKRQCMRYSHVIHDVGTAPFDLVAPILKKMSAKQLAEIENNSPQIKTHSEEVWKKLLERDFGDRSMPTSKFRKTYIKYFKEKEAHLKDASVRLRESMERLKQEKAARTITSLEVDPMAARAQARRKMTSNAPAGSKLIQKAMQTARAKGPIHSNKNIKFSSNVGLASTSGSSLHSGLKRHNSVQNINPTQAKRQQTISGMRERTSNGQISDRPLKSEISVVQSHAAKSEVEETHVKPKPIRKVPNIFLTPKR
jgi:RNA polymerase II transcription factor SIII (Elongin) subunit A